jgi:hypothetical protein
MNEKLLLESMLQRHYLGEDSDVAYSFVRRIMQDY